ncbi:MAG: ABC transporter ATP-binding protein [Bacillota bacterium]
MFKLENVRYKDILYIDSLELGQETMTAISGPSGGGKSTLLKILINLVSYDSGSIMFCNKSLEEYDPLELRRKVMMLPQNPILFGDTISECFQKSFQMTENEVIDKVKQKKFLDELRIHKLLQDNAENLSGGERQRLALAIILALSPDVLLLDEPTASLDTENEKYVIDYILGYAQENNKTIIMVTHAPKIARKVTGQQIVIAGGEVKEVQYNG